MNAIGNRTTIDDLARALGLTKSTVSRALNDYPDISEKTRLRVRKAATALSYRPLSPPRSSHKNRSRAVHRVGVAGF